MGASPNANSKIRAAWDDEQRFVIERLPVDNLFVRTSERHEEECTRLRVPTVAKTAPTLRRYLQRNAPEVDAVERP
jgi:hypothetical protein